jgi:hypothetical protein
LNEVLGTYDLRINRALVDVSLAPTGPVGNGSPLRPPQKAFAYRVELSHGGVMASQAGLDQLEIVLPQLCLRVLSHVNVERTGSQARSAGYEAFQGALEATRLERGIVDRTPGEPGNREED